MKLKMVLPLFAILLFTMHAAPLHADQGCKPLITFDLHGVAFTTATKKILNKAWHLHNKLTVFALLANPFFWHKVYRAYQHTSVAEGIFYDLSQSYPQLAPFKQDILLSLPMPKILSRQL